MIMLLVPGILFLLLLAAVLLLWRHLFYRNAFTPPPDSTDLQIQNLEGIPFLIENGLPYPAGIQASDRPALSLEGPWDFRLEGDSETSQVNVPHCFNTADSALQDYQGAVVYEKQFSLPAWAEGCLVRLAFLGSFYRSEVWLDGQPLGSRESGYLPFYFDITGLVKPGKTHYLKVRVDNQIDRHSLPQRLFQGHNPGWHPYGGLHRSVLVEICPPQYCFKLRVDAEAKPESGVVRVAALLHAPQAGPRPAGSATLRLLAEDGTVLTRVDAPVHWEAGGQFGALQHSFEIPAPLLWAPGSPHLYQLEIQTAHERCQASFGFRSLQAQDGEFLVNAKPLLLKGICRHQEDRQTGLAQDTSSVRRDLEAIQSLHSNFVRLAHYPHSTETLDLCDQMGLCAWVEIPLYQAGLGFIRFLFDKTKRATGKSWRALPGILWETNSLENHTLLLKARHELLKMIERDCNHPAVFFWGMGNECWTLHPSGARALAWLRQQAEALDTSRLFGYAAFAMPAFSQRYERSFAVTDLVSINEYFGWYYGEARQTGAFLQAISQKYAHKPLLVTETGADAVRGWHTSEPQPARRHSEEYQAWLLATQWQQMRTAPTFSGMSLWVLKDFLCPEYREDNPVPFYNLKGLLDRDGQPKAAYEQVKALYSEDVS
ncbi:MAG: glycoside hydrolase family 2 TIM barrel-domain containing protein [Chloroflexota bacterium]